MTIRVYDHKQPQLAQSAYIDPAAILIGDVHVGEDASFWPLSVARGDVQRINIGRGTNIQDGCILHTTHDSSYVPGGRALEVGNYVTVGHRCTLHACRVEDYALIGIGTTVLDAAVIGSRALLGAGTLVPEGKQLEGGYLYLGTPARQVRPLRTGELEFLEYSAEHYIRLKDQYLQRS